eukprot:852702-Rhodomonas_salina.1
MVTSVQWSSDVPVPDEGCDEDVDMPHEIPSFITESEFDDLCGEHLQIIGGWLLSSDSSPSRTLWTHKTARTSHAQTQMLTWGASLFSIFNDVVAISSNGSFSWAKFRNQHTDIPTYLKRYLGQRRTQVVTRTVQQEFRRFINQAIVPLT